jgi:hypothetical protein
MQSTKPIQPDCNTLRKRRLQDLKLWIFTFEKVSIFMYVIIASNGRSQGSMLAPIIDMLLAPGLLLRSNTFSDEFS